MSGQSTKTKREQYVYAVFTLLKKREYVRVSSQKTSFNNTELRLIAEVLSAKYEGKRLISTQIAKLLGVTRSAVSQMVQNLEGKGVLKRVPDAVDRKIAYVELAEETIERYTEDLSNCAAFVGNVVEKYGEERFWTMCKDFTDFMDLLEEERENLQIKKR